MHRDEQQHGWTVISPNFQFIPAYMNIGMEIQCVIIVKNQYSAQHIHEKQGLCARFKKYIFV